MMFLNDVNKKEEIRNLAIKDLRTLGIKFRPKKPRQHVQEKKSRKVFKVPLHLLPMQTVTLESGQQLVVPKLVHELCSFILTKVDTEGLFRKGGAKSRQNEIRLSLDAGCHLGDDHHEIDVASVLKTFFRELPEPLFPYSFHELLLRCMILQSDNLYAVLLACLLLPCEHLNTLAYFMQFLHQVTEFSTLNKMNAYNLAVVMGPTLLPIDEKLAPNTTHRLAKICQLFKLLVENASAIGVLPENIIERIALTCCSASMTEDENLLVKKKKKRRSGSLTRMFNGLKKIVSSKSGDETPNADSVTPDLLQTPCVTRSTKKRKLENGFSIKKKREILNKLPQNSALSTPYTPIRTPISAHPNPKKKTSPDTCQKLNGNKLDLPKEKKSQWSLRHKIKSTKTDAETASLASKTSTSTKGMLERRWSQVSQVANFRKNKKRNSCAASLANQKSQNAKLPTEMEVNTPEIEVQQLEQNAVKCEPDYVRISKSEYEEIKNRVTAIERRISIELESADNEPGHNLNTIENVQNAYEQTLVHTEPLSPTTDQLARRLSKELKIRRSSEQKVIRSPSARKIGSLRRRSREMEKQQNAKLLRTQSWHVSRVDVIPRVNLKRGKPNTVQTGLPPPSPVRTNHMDTNCTDVKMTPVESFRLRKLTPQSSKRTNRSSSFHGESSHSSLQSSRCPSNYSNISEKWTSADGFFRSYPTPNSSNPETCRSSLAKLRSQNAGMVLAKAKLFDGMVDSDNSCTRNTPTLMPRVRTGKLGSLRNSERQSYRIRSLKVEDRRLTKKSMSPRRRMCKSPNSTRQQRLQAAKNANLAMLLQKGKCDRSKMSPLKDCNRIDLPDLLLKTSSPRCITPKNIPHIKKNFNVKSPKRLNRTPCVDRKATPLKVIATPSQQY